MTHFFGFQPNQTEKMDDLTSPQRLAEFDEAIFEASICVADEALLEQKLDVVKRLLECGADPHTGPTDTPIMHSFCGSCCHGFYNERTWPALKLIDLLVEHGADINLPDAVCVHRSLLCPLQ